MRLQLLKIRFIQKSQVFNDIKIEKNKQYPLTQSHKRIMISWWKMLKRYQVKKMVLIKLKLSDQRLHQDYWKNKRKKNNINYQHNFQNLTKLQELIDLQNLTNIIIAFIIILNFINLLNQKLFTQTQIGMQSSLVISLSQYHKMLTFHHSRNQINIEIISNMLTIRIRNQQTNQNFIMNNKNPIKNQRQQQISINTFYQLLEQKKYEIYIIQVNDQQECKISFAPNNKNNENSQCGNIIITTYLLKKLSNPMQIFQKSIIKILQSNEKTEQNNKIYKKQQIIENQQYKIKRQQSILKIKKQQQILLQKDKTIKQLKQQIQEKNNRIKVQAIQLQNLSKLKKEKQEIQEIKLRNSDILRKDEQNIYSVSPILFIPNQHFQDHFYYDAVDKTITRSSGNGKWQSIKSQIPFSLTGKSQYRIQIVSSFSKLINIGLINDQGYEITYNASNGWIYSSCQGQKYCPGIQLQQGQIITVRQDTQNNIIFWLSNDKIVGTIKVKKLGKLYGLIDMLIQNDIIYIYQ